MDSVDNDNYFNDDIPGNSKKPKLRSQKKIKLNYESDSSVEDYQQDNESKNDDKEAESDDDMFASDKEEEPQSKKKHKKIKIELLDMKEFEKQEGIGDYDDEMQREDDEQISEGESDEENLQNQLDYYQNEDFDETMRRKAKKHQPKVEAFDLKQEAREGSFDVNGNFIRNDEANGSSDDEWGKDFKKTDISKARKAQLARDELLKTRREMKSTTYHSTDALLRDIIELLEPSETPIEALQRLKPEKKRKQQKIDEEEKKRKQVVFKITETCEELINEKAIAEIYEMTREEIMRHYKQETGEPYRQAARGVKRAREDNDDEVNEINNIDYGEKKWEFKWEGQDDINGIYSDYEMNHWKHSYFNNNVVIRKVGETNFVPIDDVQFTDI